MHPDLKQQQLLVLLTNNMKEMETELRAHSIVLEALTEEVIEPAQIGQALTWARNSTAMLSFVADKYAAFEKLTAVTQPGVKTPARWQIPGKADLYSH
jgi:hypothetical protein